MQLNNSCKCLKVSKSDKLKARLFTYPKDFTWEELLVVLRSYGYEQLKQGKTGGSRRKFKDERNHIISLHEPHPSNIVKSYAIEQVVEALQQKEKELEEANNVKAKR